MLYKCQLMELLVDQQFFMVNFILIIYLDNIRENQMFIYCNFVYTTLPRNEISKQGNEIVGKKKFDTVVLKDKKEKFRTISNDSRKSITARVNPDDLPIFNQRLKLYGFDSLNALVHEFIK